MDDEKGNKKEVNPVKLRLKEFIATQGISEREFCRRIGVSSAYVESIKQSISPKVMQTISIQYPELNPLWLLMGTGAMTKTAKEGAPQSGGVLPSEMLAELLVEARTEKAWLRSENERLAGIIESQQETIAELTNEIKKANARTEGNAASVDAG
jgi:transcriptional regulator with XRE-family HTH domain